MAVLCSSVPPLSPSFPSLPSLPSLPFVTDGGVVQLELVVEAERFHQRHRIRPDRAEQRHHAVADELRLLAAEVAVAQKVANARLHLRACVQLMAMVQISSSGG